MSFMISATEIMTVQDGVSNDVREDGRTLLQRRPVELSCTHGSGSTTGLRGADAGNGEEGTVGQLDQYAGSRVEVRVADTVVLAASTPSVVEIAAEGELDALQEMNADEEGGARPPSADHSPHANDPRCQGQLFISIDAAPHVVDYHARAMGGRSSRYRRSFLSYLAYNVRSVFGAEGVSAQGQLGGVVEAQLVSDGEDDEGESGEGDDAIGAGADGDQQGSKVKPAARATGFPARDLYIGKHYAFRIDVDVQVLESGGGNLLTAIAFAVHAALASCQLPSVVLHEASTGSSVSIEVDKSKPYAREVDWSQLPMLCVLHVAPTRHYLVDATPREALALPQQLLVAATNRGLVSFTRFQQWPSRKGSRYVARAEVGKTGGTQPSPSAAATTSGSSGIGLGSTKREREETEVNAPTTTEVRPILETAESLLMRDRNVAVPSEALPLTDFLVAVKDAVHVCQSMIADCRSQLGDPDGH